MPTKACILIRHIGNHGGLEKHARIIEKAFKQKGVDVTTLSSRNFPLSKKLNFSKMRQFDHLCLKNCQAQNFDIILGMDRTSHQTHIRAGNGVHAAYLNHRKQFDPPYKQKTHFLNPLNRTILDIEKKAFESPSLKKIYANSHMVKNEILHHYYTDPSKIEVIHNGVEWNDLSEPFLNWQSDREILLKNLCLDPEDLQLLFIGNGYKRKGLIPLLNALSKLPHKKFHLSVLGSEKHIDDFWSYVRKLGLKDQVTFYGKRSDIQKFYQLADALIIPSFYDPFANVTVEALAMGLHVLSSKTNGGSEILPESQIIPDLNDPESFAKLLEQIPFKNGENAKMVRESIKHLDFSNQLNTFMQSILS